MKTLLATALFLAVPSLVVAKPNNAKDEEAIRAACAGFDAALSKGDAKGAAALMTEDGTIVNHFGQEMRGRAAIEQHLSGMLAGPMKGMTHKITPTTIQFVKPDVALGDADIEVTGVKGPDGKPMPPIKHKGTALFVKQKGKWVFAAARGYVYAPAPPMPK